MQYSKFNNLSKSFLMQKVNISAINRSYSSDSNSFFNKSDNQNKNDPKKYSGIRKVSTNISQ